MTPEELKIRIPGSEFIFSTSRSGGPGGQNVNKVNTKVELRFRIAESQCLSDAEKERIIFKLKNKITAGGELLIVSQSERTQLMNRRKAEEKFYKLLAAALTQKRKRTSTKPTAASKARRLEKKKIRGKIKRFRKVSGINED